MTVEELLATLMQNEPDFITEHSQVQVRLKDGWVNDVSLKEPEKVVDGALDIIGANTFRMTFGTLLSLAGTLSMGRDLLLSSPEYLISELLTYHLTFIEPEDGPAFIIQDDVATAVVRPVGEMPATPHHYAELIVSILETLSHGSVSVHSWLRASVKQTTIFFIIDNMVQEVNGDVWHGGIGFTMATDGTLIPQLYPIFVSDTNAIMIPSNLDYRYKKSKNGSGLTNTEEWVDSSISVLYGLLERQMKVLLWLADHDTAAHAGNIIVDVLKEVSLPSRVRSSVVESAVDNDDTSGYGLLCDILSAQDFEDEDPTINEKIARSAGKLWEVLDNRCDECHQMYH